MIVNASMEVQRARVKVVNIGGPLDNFITPRSQRSDFRHVTRREVITPRSVKIHLRQSPSLKY